MKYYQSLLKQISLSLIFPSKELGCPLEKGTKNGCVFDNT